MAGPVQLAGDFDDLCLGSADARREACLIAGRDVSTREGNLGYTRRAIKAALGSTHLPASHRSGIQLRLVVTAPAVQRVLTLNRFDRLIPVYPSLAAAIAATGTSSTVPVTPGSGIPGAGQPEDLDRAAARGGGHDAA